MRGVCDGEVLLDSEMKVSQETRRPRVGADVVIERFENHAAKGGEKDPPGPQVNLLSVLMILSKNHQFL